MAVSKLHACMNRPLRGPRLRCRYPTAFKKILAALPPNPYLRTPNPEGDGESR